MAPSIPDPAGSPLLPTPEKMAKANLRKPETLDHADLRKPETQAKADLRKSETNDVGLAIARAQQLRGWSLKEFSEAAQRGERQLARWMDGTEHAQLDTLFAIESFRQPLIVALAERAGFGVDVHTTITIRRAA
jgi:hypothetical protein